MPWGRRSKMPNKVHTAYGTATRSKRRRMKGPKVPGALKSWWYVTRKAARSKKSGTQ